MRSFICMWFLFLFPGIQSSVAQDGLINTQSGQEGVILLAQQAENTKHTQFLHRQTINENEVQENNTLSALVSYLPLAESSLPHVDLSALSGIPQGYEIDSIIMQNAKARARELEGRNFVELIFMEQNLRTFTQWRRPHTITHKSMRVAHIYREQGKVIMGYYDMQVRGNGTSPHDYSFLVPMSGSNTKVLQVRE